MSRVLLNCCAFSIAAMKTSAVIGLTPGTLINRHATSLRREAAPGQVVLRQDANANLQ